MIILNKKYSFEEVSRILTVPDCNVIGPNKLGSGNGEAKFYFGSKTELNSFTLGLSSIKCFFLKKDLMTYLLSAQEEYMNPSQNYAGKDKMKQLWQERCNEVSQLPDIIEFSVDIQNQIAGPRGYFNSKDAGYKLFRELSLPLISYISIMRLSDTNNNPIFYWRLFVDFDAIQHKRIGALVFSYGKGNKKEKKTNTKQQDAFLIESSVRDAAAQAKYREKLLEECPFCPITKISDERLLIASHIKPYAVSDKKEAFDPKNGFILSPLFDKLFDQGFISFDRNKCMMVSNWLSPSNQKNCQVKSGVLIQHLPLDEEREKYLQYHRQFVFKG